VAAQPSPKACSANSSLTVRAEGLAELVGDIVIRGETTLAERPVPGVNLTVLLNTNVTNSIIAGGSYTDAVLTIGEPSSSNQVLHDFQQALSLIGVGDRGIDYSTQEVSVQVDSQTRT
jgi:hypothetical protein